MISRAARGGTEPPPARPRRRRRGSRPRHIRDAGPAGARADAGDAAPSARPDDRPPGRGHARRRPPLTSLLGQGSELAQVRPHVPGDDVRRIEWNVTARTGETHVRVDLAERVLVTWIALDVSASMSFGTPSGGRLTWPRASRARARPPREPTRQPARARRLRRRPEARRSRRARGAPACSASCSRCARAGDGRAAGDVARPALRMVGRMAQQRSLVAVVSDFRGPRDWRGPAAPARRRHDVLAVEIRDPREETLPNVGELRLVDPETGRQLRVDTANGGCA